MACFAKCGEDYQNNLKKCPCQAGCPSACPCPEYECPTPTTTTTATTTALTTTTAPPQLTNVLILNTRTPDNVPIITNSNGFSDKNFFFMMGKGTEVSFSCSVTWRGKHYVFGGNSKQTQISKITSCKLTNVGQLPFRYRNAACTNVADQYVYLCFPDIINEHNKCRKSTSPIGQYEDVSSSTYSHRATRIAANTRKIYFTCKKSSFFKMIYLRWEVTLHQTRKPN